MPLGRPKHAGPAFEQAKIAALTTLRTLVICASQCEQAYATNFTSNNVLKFLSGYSDYFPNSMGWEPYESCLLFQSHNLNKFILGRTGERIVMHKGLYLKKSAYSFTFYLI
jgi:hypothetical protein